MLGLHKFRFPKIKSRSVSCKIKNRRDRFRFHRVGFSVPPNGQQRERRELEDLMPARRSPPAMPRSLLADASRRRGGAAPPRRSSSAGAKLACPRSCKSCSVLAVALGRGLPAAPWPALAAAQHAPRALRPCLLDDDDAARRTPPLLAAAAWWMRCSPPCAGRLRADAPLLAGLPPGLP